MIVNRSGSKIFGAYLSKAEQKALNIETRKSYAKSQEQYCMDFDGALLYYMHTKYGHGKKWLRDFWDGFNKLHTEIVQNYMVGNDEAAWVCREELKKIGVDVKAWYEEDLKKESNEK